MHTPPAQNSLHSSVSCAAGVETEGFLDGVCMAMHPAGFISFPGICVLSKGTIWSCLICNQLAKGAGGYQTHLPEIRCSAAGWREEGTALPWVLYCGIDALKGEQEQPHLLSWKNSSLRRCPRGVQGCHFNHRAHGLQRAALPWKMYPGEAGPLPWQAGRAFCSSRSWVFPCAAGQCSQLRPHH